MSHDAAKVTAEQWLTDWFVARCKLAQAKLGKAAPATVRDTDYFEAGWLTSMEVVEFVTEVEQRFDIRFSDRDLQDPRFVTIAGLADLVLHLSALTSEGS